MNTSKQTSGANKTPQTQKADAAKKERLSKALRENLQRRKAASTPKSDAS